MTIRPGTVSGHEEFLLGKGPFSPLSQTPNSTNQWEYRSCLRKIEYHKTRSKNSFLPQILKKHYIPNFPEKRMLVE